MDERTERRILEKAEYVGDAIKVLVRKRDSLSFEEYRAQREQRDVVEREFETAIEACIDIGKMILEAENENVPNTTRKSFTNSGAGTYSMRRPHDGWHRRRASGIFSHISTGTKSTTRMSTTSFSKTFHSFSTT